MSKFLRATCVFVFDLEENDGRQKGYVLFFFRFNANLQRLDSSEEKLLNDRAPNILLR